MEPQGRIIKVLPHYLDLKGRHSLSPSLYERDAYQSVLRKNPSQRSGLRFDIQWKVKYADAGQLKMKVEVRASHAKEVIVVEQPVHPKTWWRRWTSLQIGGAQYKAMGEVISWRVTLWEGSKLLSEQKSFLWN